MAGRNKDMPAGAAQATAAAAKPWLAGGFLLKDKTQPWEAGPKSPPSLAPPTVPQKQPEGAPAMLTGPGEATAPPPFRAPGEMANTSANATAQADSKFGVSLKPGVGDALLGMPSSGVAAALGGEASGVPPTPTTDPSMDVSLTGKARGTFAEPPPSGVAPAPTGTGEPAFKFTPDTPEGRARYGGAIYSDTPQGATPQSFDKAMSGSRLSTFDPAPMMEAAAFLRNRRALAPQQGKIMSGAGGRGASLGAAGASAEALSGGFAPPNMPPHSPSQYAQRTEARNASVGRGDNSVELSSREWNQIMNLPRSQRGRAYAAAIGAKGGLMEETVNVPADMAYNLAALDSEERRAAIQTIGPLARAQADRYGTDKAAELAAAELPFKYAPEAPEAPDPGQYETMKVYDEIAGQTVDRLYNTRTGKAPQRQWQVVPPNTKGARQAPDGNWYIEL